MIMKRILALLALVLCITACNKNNADLITINEIVNVQNGLLVNDAGVRYSLTDHDMLSQLMSLKRVFIIGQIEPVSNQSYDYKLYLMQFIGVNVKDCVKSSEITDDDKLGHDPVHLSTCWLDGGYINASLAFSYNTYNGYQGVANIVFDQTRSTAKDLYFILRNNQEGKTWENESLSPGELEFGTGIYSFEYTPLLDPSYKGDINFHFEWVWFQADPANENVPLRTTEPRSETFTLKAQ